MFAAVNGMMLDVLAAVARKDYEDRRRRQAQGQAEGKGGRQVQGPAEDWKRNAGIAAMLGRRVMVRVQRAFDCSRATVAKIAKRLGSDRPADCRVVAVKSA